MASSPRGLVSCMTTNPGRLRLAAPSPYVTHAPRHGKPGRVWPPEISKAPGAWLLARVWHEWMNAMSSTNRAVLGRMSDTHEPDWPYCFHPNGDLRHLPSVVKNPVLGSAPASFSPCRFCNSGL